MTASPGSEFKVYSPLQALLYLPEKKKQEKKDLNKVLDPPKPAKEYVHTLSQLVDNGFPITIKSVSNNINPETKKVERIIEYEQESNHILFDDLIDRPIPEAEEMIGIDCEMCLTKLGSELTRITAVDMNLNVIYDQLVKPKNPILDYKTKYSGITKEILDPITKTLEEVQDELKKFISKNTILVGHSLENDLRALKICHFNVIDTSIWFPHTSGPPAKMSLKALVQTHLNRIIQIGTHDSAQDAIAAMELAKLKIKHGPSFGITKIGGITIFEKIKKAGHSGVMIDRNSLVSTHCREDGIACDSDNQVSIAIKNTFESNNSPDFIYAQLHDLNAYYRSLAGLYLLIFMIFVIFICFFLAAEKKDELENGKDNSEEQSDDNKDTNDVEPITSISDVLKKIDGYIKDIYESLPKDSFFIVTSGQANLAPCSAFVFY